MKKLFYLLLLLPILISSPKAGAFTADNTSHKEAYKDYRQFIVLLNIKHNWNGSASTCNAGSVSAQYRDATLSTINYVRTLSGLQPVSFDPYSNSIAQKAALIMHANNDLSHSPPASWLCYSTEGDTAAGQSNLALGISGASSIQGYMQDPGESNRLSLGHRRWILNAQTLTMGSGSTSNSNSLVVFGTPGTQTTYPDYYSWPSEGYFPINFDYTGAWSFSASNNSVDMSSATVSVTKNGSPVSVNIIYLPNGYGNPTVSWDIEIENIPVTAVYNYEITVGNMILSGSPLPSQTYTVSLFNALGGPAGSVYRLYNSDIKRHLFTADYSEANIVSTSARWKQEGLKFFAQPASNCTGASPVYRFYSEVLKTHLYTRSENEKATLIGYNDPNVWRYEGVAYCAFTSAGTDRNAVYRFYSEVTKTHLYTSDENEKNVLIGYNDPGVWRYEGVAYYAEPN